MGDRDLRDFLDGVSKGGRGPSGGSIALLTGNPLCRNPRVLKEALALGSAGYDVLVLGAWWDDLVRGEDLELLSGVPFRFVPVIDATDRRAAASCHRLLARLLTRLARDLHRGTGRETRWQLGPAVDALARAARSRRFQLVVAHSEPALWVAERLRRRGVLAGVDFEDWFSEDLAPEARRGRPLRLLRRLEGVLLREGVHATCPSEAMRDALAEAYGGRKPVVVYNAFPWGERGALDGRALDHRDRSRPSIHWYSQTLGPGRGLEELAAALHHLDVDAELHLRGHAVPGFVDSLRSTMPERWRARTFFHGLVPNGELLSRIAEHDVGYAGEVPGARSRDLTVTNKILHYLLAGLAVVASDTAGHREVAAHAAGGLEIFPSGDVPALAARLEGFLRHSGRLDEARRRNLQAAERRFSWEHQEPRLVHAVDESFSRVLGARLHPSA